MTASKAYYKVLNVFGYVAVGTIFAAVAAILIARPKVGFGFGDRQYADELSRMVSVVRCRLTEY